MSHDLFCYGTLQFNAVIQQLLGRIPESAPASLANFATFSVKSQTYPGLAEQPGASTTGRIYRTITDEELQILDRFEGQEYFRAKLTLLNQQTKQKETVYTYYYRMDLLHQLELTYWCPQQFQKQHLSAFLNSDEFLTDGVN